MLNLVRPPGDVCEAVKGAHGGAPLLERAVYLEH